VSDIRAQGTTIILVEQSVNLALAMAETAYFMEKGEIRFHGPTKELLERPDILRSVFLEGAATVTKGEAADDARAGAALEEVAEDVSADLGLISTAPGGASRRRAGVENREADGNGQAEGLSVPDRLEVVGVTKRYGGVVALDDVTFKIGGGQVVGFIGPNGAGKTTLFDAIGGFIPLDGGTVQLGTGADRRDITALPPHQRAWLGLGRSFQDGRLFPSMSVAETLKIALERKVEVRDPFAAAVWLPAVKESEAKLQQRVDELIDLTGIGDFRDKLLRELSTGSRRIVDLACVLAHEPTVLLLDEPSSGIAQREAEALGPLLLRIRAETGTSLLVIEHDVPLLLSIADRLIALDLGEVVADGAPVMVVNDPRVVSSYLGTSGVAVARSGTTVTS
jgi:branched-chain amino acid transport system ATP-binding protein